MKALSKLLISVAFLFYFMWQNTYSQLFYPEYKEEKYLPPYDSNVIVVSPDVEKWMNEQIVNKDNYKAGQGKVAENKGLNFSVAARGIVNYSSVA